MPSGRHSQNDKCLFSNIPEVKEIEDHITEMFQEMNKKNLFSEIACSNRCLVNVFTGKNYAKNVS